MTVPSQGARVKPRAGRGGARSGAEGVRATARARPQTAIGARRMAADGGRARARDRRLDASRAVRAATLHAQPPKSAVTVAAPGVPSGEPEATPRPIRWKSPLRRIERCGGEFIQPATIAAG